MAYLDSLSRKIFFESSGPPRIEPDLQIMVGSLQYAACLERLKDVGFKLDQIPISLGGVASSQ